MENPQPAPLAFGHNDQLRYQRISQELDSFVSILLQKREKAIRDQFEADLQKEVSLREKYFKDWSAADTLLHAIAALSPRDDLVGGVVVSASLFQQIQAAVAPPA